MTLFTLQNVDNSNWLSYLGCSLPRKSIFQRKPPPFPPPPNQLWLTLGHTPTPIGNKGTQLKFTINSVAHRRQFVTGKSTWYKVKNACIWHSASDELSRTSQINKIDAWCRENKQHISLPFLKPFSFFAWQGQQVIWGHMPFCEAGEENILCSNIIWSTASLLFQACRMT